MFIKVTLLIILWCMAWNVHAVVAGGMVANYHNFENRTGGYAEMEADFQITHEPGNNGLTFWANQFKFEQVSTGGYTGLQQNQGTTKRAIFSIWNASGWNNVNGAKCSYFSHEGSGVSCLINYPWKEGQRYRLAWSRISQNNSEQIWRSRVIDLSTNKSTIIGEIKVPQTWGGMSNRLTQFVENYAQGSQQYNRCNEVPATTNIFFKPAANGVKALRASTRIYGNCATVAQSFCSSNGDCIATINSSSYTQQAPFVLKNKVQGYCADSLAGGDKMGLYVCNFNQNQKLKTDQTHRLYLMDQNKCLSVNYANNVVTETCNNSSQQRWLFIPSKHQYLHLATGKCMDAAEGGKLNKKIQIYSCLGNSYQYWDRN